MHATASSRMKHNIILVVRLCSVSSSDPFTSSTQSLSTSRALRADPHRRPSGLTNWSHSPRRAAPRSHLQSAHDSLTLGTLTIRHHDPPKPFPCDLSLIPIQCLITAHASIVNSMFPHYGGSLQSPGDSRRESNEVEVLT